MAALVGRGDGLTPYGDDVLCGWLAMHRAAGVETPDVDEAVREHLSRTTLLSATLLDCAIHGEVIPEFAAYVAALGTPDEAERGRRGCPRSVTRPAVACSKAPAARWPRCAGVAA